MNILVTGGTGTVGSQVVRELLPRGAQVTVLTRDASKAAKLPAGVKAVTGDLSQVETVKRVFKGFDGVFLINTVSPTEAVQRCVVGLCASRAERQAIGVRFGPERRCGGVAAALRRQARR